MNIQQAKEIKLTDYLSALGHQPKRCSKSTSYYLSPLHADIPVVLVTAFADVQLAVKGLKAGAADFITKPWDNDELIRTLKDAIDNNNHIDTLETVETQHVRKVLDKCHGNISRAAELLGITRQTLYSKIKK